MDDQEMAQHRNKLILSFRDICKKEAVLERGLTIACVLKANDKCEKSERLNCDTKKLE
jgi:hypothetical protein